MNIKKIGLILLFVSIISFPGIANTSISAEILILRNSFYVQKILKLIRGAKKNIRICMSECEYSKDSENIVSIILQEVVNQARRGISVEFILDQGTHLESVKKNRSAKDFLYFNGINIYEDAKDIQTRYNMLIVDDFTSVIGSTVWTEESINKNEELELWIEGEAFAKALLKRFNSIKVYGKPL